MMDERNLSRRQLLTGGFFKNLLRQALPQVPAALVQRAPTKPSIHRRAPPPLRPPGAVAEPDFLAGCTSCGDCITACPYKAIVVADNRWGVAAGTPMINPAVSPCLQCEDTPCITACEPAVLRRPDPKKMPVMGTARIDPFACMAHQGTSCSTCRERCPVPGAISITNGRPTIQLDACTGCGVCVHVCPAPRNAVALLPARDRLGISS